MKVRFKKLVPEAVLPAHSKQGDAGLDLTAVSAEFDDVNNCIIYNTGLAVEIPVGFVGLLFPRSSIYKTLQYQTNHVGIIDSGYRGEIKTIMRDIFAPNDHPSDRFRKFPTDFYHAGDRVAQLVIVPFATVQPEEVTELSDTQRGTNGHGSTGKR